MTREEAIKEAYGIPVNKKQHEALQILIPELAESEDEKFQKYILKVCKECVEANDKGLELSMSTTKKLLAYLEKQKDTSKAIEAVDKIDKYIDENVANAHDMKDSNPDKKYYRGWDDALAKMSGILQDVYSGSNQKEKEGYEAIPVESTLEYKLGFKAGKESEKQKEKMTAEEYEKSELFQLKLKTQYANGYQDGLVQKEQSITANDLDEEIHRFFDDCIDVHEAKLYGNISERVIPLDCYELTARHFAKWVEKQKEQKPIKMEVYEIGKGTTICGQDYKCKKDYKEGNCWYIKDVIYHCGKDGYLIDQNGVSWSCTPEWFNEYIYTNNELVEEEKNNFVSGQFLQCKLSFDGFKEGEHYWLEYVGNDMYVGRSDNILNQKFHITPRQLYTLFSQQLEEVQAPSREEKQVSLNYEPPFDENPSVKEIIEALVKHLKEQDGFLTAIDCVSTKAILRWLEKQKEQKHVEWKPTHEQMVALSWAANGMLDNRSPSAGDIKAGLRSLYNDLQSKLIQPVEWSEDKFPKDIEKDATQFCFDKGFNITPHQAKEIATHYLMIGHNEGYVEGRKNAHIPAKELGLPSSMDFNQEWSEEDKQNLDNIIWLCENCEKGIENVWIPSQAKEIKRLIKSLRPPKALTKS